MQPSLLALEQVVSKYRTDVHHLPPGAPGGAVVGLEDHLDRRLPEGIRQFLSLHNGANLFRGSLRLRSTSEVVVASEEAPQVVLFADTVPGDVCWAWAEDRDGRAVFGRWRDRVLEPMYASFRAWLTAEIAVVESRTSAPDEQDEIRLRAAPQDPFQLQRSGARELAAGHLDRARAALAVAVDLDPGNVEAWQLLGDALIQQDQASAAAAWRQALRRCRIPLAWPGAPCLDPAVLDRLEGTFASPERWERELQEFLHEGVLEVTTTRQAAVVSAVGRALVRSMVGRGQRARVQQLLAHLLRGGDALTWPGAPWHLLLDLVELEISLGRHDEAESLLRHLRRRGPPGLQGAGLLRLARIVIGRQEPWAEAIAQEASAAGLDPDDRIQLELLRVERAVRQQRAADARRLLEGLQPLVEGSVGARPGARPGSRLGAQLALARGDVLRLEGAHADAREAYLEGQRLAGVACSEVGCRLHLRLADLYRSQGELAGAEAEAEAAAEGFGLLELPVREAWAQVRIARFLLERSIPGEPGPQAGAAVTRARMLCQAARECFIRSDLAAGVAAVDSLQREPGASLSWHLERAASLARARHDAQRSRPPLERADADRSERRLGAHRLAIAACDVGVVAALAREMEASVRASATGRGRATDPPVLRYIAAVDLLSGHRSYEAARVLLDHLLIRDLQGVMLRALQGAIARSPNAAMVDGLLRCVEQPTEHPASSVASAAELLGLRRERASVRALVRLLQGGSSLAPRRAAIVALGRIGQRSVAESIVAALDDAMLAEAAALSLLMLGDRRGVDFHGRALTRPRSELLGSPGEIVGRYGGPDHLLLLMRAAGGEDERALGALQGLGLLGDPRGVPALLHALGARHQHVIEVASGALQILTGHAEDASEPGLRGRWSAWWARHQHTLPAGVRHRHGAVFDCGALIEQMSHRDTYVRRTAYDELVITSGASLPFDADGPWRIQRAHLRAWRLWWQRASVELEAGRWYLDGELIH